MDWLRDLIDDLAANHIKGIILTWAILTCVAAVSLAFSINFGEVISVYRTWSAAMNGLWIFDTALFIIVGVTRKRAGY